MNWSSLMFRTSSYNQQPGADKTKASISPEGQSLLGPIWPCYQGQFEYYLVQILTIKLWPQKNTTFYNVVTIFFSLQRKLIEKKNYLFKNSCPEEITPPIPLDQSSLDHLSRPSLTPKTKRKKRGTKSFKILFQPIFTTSIRN